MICSAKGPPHFYSIYANITLLKSIENPAEICQMQTCSIPDVAQRNEYRKRSSHKIAQNFIATDKPPKRGGQRQKNPSPRSYSVLAEMYGLVCRDYQPLSEPPNMPGRIPWGAAVLCASAGSSQAFFVAVHFLLNSYKTRKPNSCFPCAEAG